MIEKALSLPFSLRTTTLRAIAFFLNLGILTIAVIELFTRPVEGFETSFYGAAGSLVWICLGVVLACSIAMAFFNVLASDEAKEPFPTETLVLVGIANLIILFAPYVRGYAGYGRSDSMVHVGFVLDLVAGRQLEVDPYPAVHMLQGVLSSATGLQPAILVRYMPLFICLLYWCGLYLLGGQCFPRGNGRWLTMLLGMPLMYPALHLEVQPLLFSVAFMPFVVYLWLRARRSDRPVLWTTYWVMLCLGIAFFHPLFALLVVGALLVAGLLMGLHSRRTDEPSRGARRLPNLSNVTPFGGAALVVIVVLCLWLWRNWPVWGFAVVQTEAALQEPFWRSSLSLDYVDAQRAMMSVSDILLIAFRMYGHFLVYLLLSVYAAFLLLFRNRKKEQNPFLRGVAAWFVGILFGSTAGVLSALGMWRVIEALVSLSPVLIASIPGSRRFSTSRKWRWTTGLLVVIALFVYVSAMLAFFTDPYTHRVSSHMTRAELDGMEWFLNNKEGYPTRSLTWRLQQFGAYLFGEAYVESRASARRSMPGELLVGNHFDFSDTPLPAGVEEIYIPVTAYDRAYHLEVFRSSNRFTERDFEWLSETPAASRIYSNGDVDIFLVHDPRARR